MYCSALTGGTTQLQTKDRGLAASFLSQRDRALLTFHAFISSLLLSRAGQRLHSLEVLCQFPKEIHPQWVFLTYLTATVQS